jgi:predicted SAM-dependent methyltransferase
MEKQVDKSHYSFGTYFTKRRWVSVWHQLEEIIALNPSKVLEIGPGPGLLKAAAGKLDVYVETLDLDPELNPDHVASVFDMPFSDNAFDVVCAFQMLEHLPFDQSKMAFKEMSRTASKAVVISLPDAATRYPISIHIPRIGELKFSFPKPRLHPPVHVFDGEHYWEINKQGYTLEYVTSEFVSVAETVRLTKTYRVPENPYHRFFVFEKCTRGNDR